MPAGSFGGSLINSWLSDKIGRKYCIIVSGILWILGSITQAASYKVRDLVAGRVISGLAVGIASSVIPIYIAEITKPGVRGRVVALQQWAITWGIFFQFFVQYGCSFINGTASFRLPWSLQMIPAILLCFGMLILPESPRWLLEHGRSEEALKILADVHGQGREDDELVQLEYNEMKQAMDFDRTQAAHSYRDLLKPGIFRRVWLGVSVQMWSQLCGMNVMMYYVIFPTRVRGKAVSVSTASNWAFNFALAWFAPPSLRNIQWKTYFLFGTFCGAAFVHVFFCFPETKGRTLEEMEIVFSSGNHFTAWRLGNDVGKKTLEDVIGHAEKGSIETDHIRDRKVQPETPPEDRRSTI
ncbi:hypothetical protein P7C70_g1137, partial [Phenoliferia sp. Uapishka_3]